MSEFLESKDLKRCDWHSDFPLITCGTGCGKTHFVMTRMLANHIEAETGKSINFVLVLAPTQAIRDSILKNMEYQCDRLSEADLMMPIEDPQIVRVACFAQLSKFLSDGNEVKNIPDLIAFDEIDLLFSWSLYFRGYVETWNWVLSKRKEMFVCGMTATPELLLNYVGKDAGIPFVDITPDFPIKYKAKSIEVIRHSAASTYLKTLETNRDNKVLVYVRSASMCKNLAARYGEKAGFVVSKSNKNYEEQEFETSEFSAFGTEKFSLRDYLIEHEKLPPQIEVLFFNDSIAAGFNVKDPSVKTVVADTVDLAIAIQAKGRVRHDLDRFVFVYNNKEKKPYFRNLERARAFFEEERGQEYLKAWYDQEKEMKGLDILTFRCGDSYKANPFAKAIYQYVFDIYARIEGQEYFEPLTGHSDNVLSYFDGADIRNISNFKSLDVAALFGLKDGETEKIITAKELQGVAKRANIKDAKSNVLGKDTFRKYVNRYSDYEVSPLGRKTIGGVRAVYYRFKKIGVFVG